MTEKKFNEIHQRLQMFFDEVSPGANTSMFIDDFGKVKILVMLKDRNVLQTTVLPEHFDAHWRDCLRKVFNNYLDHIAEKVLNEKV